VWLAFSLFSSPGRRVPRDGVDVGAVAMVYHLHNVALGVWVSYLAAGEIWLSTRVERQPQGRRVAFYIWFSARFPH
jgi:hypothetical protein